MTWSLFEAQWLALRQVQVPLLAAGAPEVRVLHLSDLHLVPRQRRKIAWVRSLAEYRPDLVINTGDNMADDHALPAVLEALEPLLAFPGAFVMGSNDYYAPVWKNPLRYLQPRAPGTPTSRAPTLPGHELGRALTSAGWQDLTNARGQVHLPGTSFDLVGVDDPHLECDELPEPGSAPAAPGTVQLGLTHAPYQRVLAAMRSAGVDLTLAGHTHGGQICLPGYGALVTNCDLDTGRASGLHGWPGQRPEVGDQDSMWLHVSAGLGTSPFTPVRFACRPEATLLILTPGE